MQYDIMMIGPATRDVNIDYTGQKASEIGGAVFFCAHAARAAGARVYISVKINQADRDIIDAFQLPGESISLLPSAKTMLMCNEYFSADRERRKASCLAQSDSIAPGEIPQADCALYHLAGLLYGDFQPELIPLLAERGRVSADIQSFLRRNENGEMNFRDWEQKTAYFRYFDFLKTDAAEAEILTGQPDRRKAAEQMHKWGAKEVLISHHTEMLAYDGRQIYTCPVKARNLSGRTGRGDSVFGAYLAKRAGGTPVPEALRYATALVSLKMETPGPFRGSPEDVAAYLHEFYR